MNLPPTHEEQLRQIAMDFQQFIDADTQRDIGATFNLPLVERIRIVLEEFDRRSALTTKEREEFEDQLEQAEKDYRELERDNIKLSAEHDRLLERVAKLEAKQRKVIA